MTGMDDDEFDLLPTPSARDAKGGDLPSRKGGPSLPQAVESLGYTCKDCLRWFKGSKALSAHKQVHAPLDPPPPEIAPDSAPAAPAEGLGSGFGTLERDT